MVADISDRGRKVSVIIFRFGGQPGQVRRNLSTLQGVLSARVNSIEDVAHVEFDPAVVTGERIRRACGVVS